MQLDLSNLKLLPFYSKVYKLTLASIHRILNFLLPFQCPLCAQIISQRTLCSDCWAKLTFLTAPNCNQCGYPFEFWVPPTTVCLACEQDPPPFKKARSVFAYEATSKQLVFAFKHGRKLILAPLLAKWLFYHGNHLFTGIHIIVPVPLHWTRLLRRRFNQSTVLANLLATYTRLPCYPSALKRIRATKSQGRMTRKQRFENVKGAFNVSKSYQEAIQGKTVLLIDDVYTTGATLRSCSQALLQAGAKEIRVLTLTRSTLGY